MTEEARIKPDARNPLGDRPRVLPGRHAATWTLSGSKQEFARLLASDLYVVIDCLAGQFRQFEPDRMPGLPLSHRRPVDRVLDLKRNDIAAAQFAVDGQIKHRQVSCTSCDLKFCSDRPDVPWPERRFCSD